MARIPTSFDLSSPGSLVSGRAVAQLDTTAVGKGLQQAGQGLQQAGSDLGMLAKQEQNQSKVLEATQADAGYLADREALRQKITSDGDYGTQVQRFDDGNKALIQKWAPTITSPRAREIWTLDAQKNSLGTRDAIYSTANNGIKQTQVAGFETNLDKYYQIAADPKSDDLARKQALASTQATIDEAVKAGIIAPETGKSWGDKYVRGADFARAVATIKSPAGNAAVLPPVTAGGSQTDREAQAMSYFMGRGYSKAQAAGIVGNLIHESGGLQPGIKNPGDGSDGSDSIGVGQWNGKRASDLKAFAAAQGKDWHDYGVQLAFVDHELNGAYSGTKQKLLAAQSPDEAAGVIVTGYERPRGSQSGAEASHGWSNRRDQARRLAGGDFKPGDLPAAAERDDFGTAYSNLQRLYPSLTPEQLQSAAGEAVSAKNGFAVQNRAAIEQSAQDAPAAIQNTGQYSGFMPNANDFANAYAQDGDKRFQQFQAAVDTSRAVYGMRTQSNTDLTSIVNQPPPTNSGEGAALAEAKYSTLRQAAAQTLKGRLEDPANATMMAFPAIRDAWQSAGSDPEHMQSALTMMAAGQDNLGIPKTQQVLLPQGIAKAQVEAFKNDAAPFQQRVSAVTGLVLRSHDPDQQRAIFQQLVKEGLPAETEGAIEAYSGGRTGDGDFLMQAAMSDPAKLPGKLEATPAKIQDEIQTNYGPQLDAAYGVTLGTPANLQRAQNGGALIVKAAQLKMAQGMPMTDAVKAAVGAMFGKDRQFLTQTADGTAAAIAVPLGADPSVIRTRLPSALPQIRQALIDLGQKQAEAIGADKPSVKAALSADAANHAQIVASSGKWVNLGGGYAFVDPYTNRPVPGDDGKPLIITDDQLGKMTGNASPAAIQSQTILDTEAKPPPADPFWNAYDQNATPPGGAGAVTPKAPALPPGVRVGPDGRKWQKNPEYEKDPTVYPWVEVK